MSDLLQVLRTDGSRRVRLVGELDASNADSLLTSLGGDLADGGDLTLDLSGLGFVDSMGLRSFLRIASALEATGQLVLEAPQQFVARTLQLVGLEKLPNIVIVANTPAGAPSDLGHED